MKGSKMARLGITVTEEVNKSLLALSKQTGIPLSEIVRRLIDEHLQKQGLTVKSDVQHGGRRKADDAPKRAP